MSDTVRDGLQLDVLGAGPAYTDRVGSTGAAYLVRTPTTSILLDLGQGSFPRLAATLEPGSLDAVVVSHLHPDHFIDLVPLRHYLHWQRRPAGRVRVIAPAGLEARLDALHEDPGFCRAALDIEVLEPGERRIGDLAVEAARVTHTRDSFGLRVSAAGTVGTGLVYSGDCGRAKDLDALIRSGDTLLVEVSFGAGPVPPGAMHLDGPAIAALAGRTRPGRILLTHLQMGHDVEATLASVRAGYDGPLELVEPGTAITLGG